MAEEAMKRNIGPEGREGGIILDEMAIQVYWYISLVQHNFWLEHSTTDATPKTIFLNLNLLLLGGPADEVSKWSLETDWACFIGG